MDFAAPVIHRVPLTGQRRLQRKTQIKLLAILIKADNPQTLSSLYGPPVRFQLTSQHPEQRGFATSIRAQNTEARSRRENKREFPE